MFLFKRSVPVSSLRASRLTIRARSVQPFYGFFVLNRQGLEYVQEDLTPDSSVELMGDFIAFEPGPSGTLRTRWARC